MPTKFFNTFTYKVVAENGDTAPSIRVEVEGNRFAARDYAALLLKAFRRVDVYNNETGEVMFSSYVSDERFSPDLSVTECLSLLQAKVKDNRAR